MQLIFRKPLPGTRSHLEMASAHRRSSLLSPPPETAVNAAVLAVLTPANEGRTPLELLEWTVLLIRRNTYPGVHSGQIALPGGKREKGDAGLTDTAYRETLEEVGIEKGDLEMAGPLTSIYVPSSNFVIHPFVAVHKSAKPPRTDPREVIDCKFVPLHVFNPGRAALLEFPARSGAAAPSPAWRYENYVIWGATAMILSELYRLVDEEALTRD